MPADRHIVHVDMDEFFAAVEKLDHPEYRGKPLLIGGDPKARGVVSTASYEARPFGCRSAMPMSQAIRLCPHAIVLPVRGQRYSEVSDQVFEVLGRFTPLIEPLSIDEAFLDITGTQRLLGPPDRVAADIRHAVREATGLTASVGLAPNKFLAKLASDLDKPDGLTIITREDLHARLDPLPIGKLWGVGPATASQFERLGIHTIGQLRAAPAAELARAMGDSAEHFVQLANGLDERAVTPDSEAKSIGQEETFARDEADRGRVLATLLEQSEEVARRVRRAGLECRTVTVKIRYGDFKTITRSRSRLDPTALTREVWDTARAVFGEWAEAAFSPVRLIGVTVSGLSRAGLGQQKLFVDADEQRQTRLDEAVDRIKNRYGRRIIGRGQTGDDSR